MTTTESEVPVLDEVVIDDETLDRLMAQVDRDGLDNRNGFDDLPGVSVIRPM